MSYLTLKSLHMLSMVLLFGTGLGSAWYKWMADRRGELRHILATNRNVVLADWLFTTPSMLIQPLTGLGMAWQAQLPLSTPWIGISLALYLLAGACWIPVLVLQIRMRDMARFAYARGGPLPALYWRYARIWFWLGVPAFMAMLLVVLLMVFKPV